MTVKIVVVDDQEMVRSGFVALLDTKPDIEVVGTAPDGAEALQVVRRTHPDVVLMDVRMPVMDGIEALRQLSGDPATAQVKVVMLTTFDADEYVHESLRLGASGFLLKDASPDELASAIRVVHAGEALLSPSVTRQVIAQFARAPRRRRADPRLKQLTEREREVLENIARGRSNSEIAAELFLAEQTVKTHVSRILGKLGLRDRAQAVVFAYESGLVAPHV
ncbi:DNA-binding NarL/FixJ family response regulator [Nocardioides luteus]|uniref:DNA-binding response regulator n=1 Tax=Nocardioides luteus TaxID=1844 RepID=A0ABQ5SZI7_9ACTN|nr:response regulator transcription factor [Nocardioides luteus]MDR7312616.1 DNA-binding NarL/FixJ family response regulator [Nocardioides luteus]GGR46324.1 DNA-binding response regulator [Nocardioides luteus]GLJ68864.1 DNA-binding response regulator [Nocardioides luteus]